MLANTDAEDVMAIAQQFRELVNALLETVAITPISLDIDVTSDGNFHGFDDGQFYVVRSGSITARHQGKTIYILQEGDMLLPDIAGSLEGDIAVHYGSETGARLESFSALDFMGRVFADPAAIRLWTRLLISYCGLMLRITASNLPEDIETTPGFEVYQPQEIIIRQGDRADYVFNMTSGVAEVLVNDVNVGRIGEGEIFGAMAVLTQANRSATVRAKTACSIVKVPGDQFTELIKRNPATIHSLLVDMANSIVHLNEQLAGLGDNRHMR